MGYDVDLGKLVVIDGGYLVKQDAELPSTFIHYMSEGHYIKSFEVADNYLPKLEEGVISFNDLVASSSVRASVLEYEESTLGTYLNLVNPTSLVKVSVPFQSPYDAKTTAYILAYLTYSLAHDKVYTIPEIEDALVKSSSIAATLPYILEDETEQENIRHFTLVEKHLLSNREEVLYEVDAITLQGYSLTALNISFAAAVLSNRVPYTEETLRRDFLDMLYNFAIPLTK